MEKQNKKMKNKKILATTALAFIVCGIFISTFMQKESIGITLWESESRKIGDDLILVAPIHADFKADWTKSEVSLINLSGNVEKKWTIPGITLTNRIGPDGLLYSMVLAPTNYKKNNARGEIEKIIATNLNGKIISEIKLDNLHHDFDFINHDRFISIQYEKIDRSIINIIDPKSKLEIGLSDKIVIFNRQGQISWEWSLKDHLKEFDFSLQAIESNSNELIDEESFTHVNSIAYVKENPISKNEAFLISSRRLNTVLLVEIGSGKILWHAPKDSMSRQHDATISKNLVTVFNNNISDGKPMSVQVWDVLTNNKIKDWSIPTSYHTSQLMGGARWLTDGSLLISISTSGALLEIDPAGIMSWSFIFRNKEKLKQPVWEVGQNFFRAEVYPEAILKTLQ